MKLHKKIIKSDTAQFFRKKLVTVTNKLAERVGKWFDGLYPKQQLKVVKIVLFLTIGIVLCAYPFYLLYLLCKREASLRGCIEAFGAAKQEIKEFWNEQLEPHKEAAKKDTKLHRALK